MSTLFPGRLIAVVFRYLAEHGFPEAFVLQRRTGSAPDSSSSRDLLVRQMQSTARSNGTQPLQDAIEARLVVQHKAGTVRDFFPSETWGYILFPERGPRPRGGCPGPIAEGHVP
jgi:hypothetical protein